MLISGPSSSGKTTFAKRLGVQLRVLGLNPVLISLDDYFVDREKTPRDENGEYDYEALEAIDLEQFNDHLKRLERARASIFRVTTSSPAPASGTTTPCSSTSGRY